MLVVVFVFQPDLALSPLQSVANSNRRSQQVRMEMKATRTNVLRLVPLERVRVAARARSAVRFHATRRGVRPPSGNEPLIKLALRKRLS